MTEQAWLFTLAVLLVALSWIFVAAESAFARLSRARLAEAVERGDRRARRLLGMAEDPAKYVNVLLLASTITTLAALAVLIEALLLAVPWSDGYVLMLGTAVMCVVTYVVVGVSARTVGRQNPDRVAAMTLGLVKLVSAVLHPLARLLILLGNAVTPGRGYREGPFASQAELRELLDSARASALIEDEERRMIHSVFELGDTTARQVMVPRTEMVLIERGKTLRQALSLALRSGFSRIPVIGEDADDIVGVVFLKDVIGRMFDRRDADRSENVESLMRPPFLVPDSKPVDDLLREMQLNRVHMAVVVDEFGGTAGLVTIEDILEEIVGEIADEYDDEVPEIARLDDGTLRVSARLSLEHLKDETGIDVDSDVEGVDTVGGLFARRLGRVPIPGAEIVEQGWRLTVESAEGRRNRIGTVLATPPQSHRTEEDRTDD
jgi:CBS domain containing-hemolysin-like protein